MKALRHMVLIIIAIASVSCDMAWSGLERARRASRLDLPSGAPVKVNDNSATEESFIVVSVIAEQFDVLAKQAMKDGYAPLSSQRDVDSTFHGERVAPDDLFWHSTGNSPNNLVFVVLDRKTHRVLVHLSGM